MKWLAWNMLSDRWCVWRGLRAGPLSVCAVKCCMLYIVFLNLVSCCQLISPHVCCLVGLVVKASALRMAYPGFESHFLRGDSFRCSHTSDLEIGAPVATLPADWCYRVSAGIGSSGVRIV